jgi:hypothetical protein
MRSIRSLNFEYRSWNNRINIIQICGLYVRKFVQKNRKTTAGYTHYTQHGRKLIFTHMLYSFFYSVRTHTLHNKSIQNLSVITTLYTLYTGPITTTTLNIYKKGL